VRDEHMQLTSCASSTFCTELSEYADFLYRQIVRQITRSSLRVLPKTWGLGGGPHRIHVRLAIPFTALLSTASKDGDWVEERGKSGTKGPSRVEGSSDGIKFAPSHWVNGTSPHG